MIYDGETPDWLKPLLEEIEQNPGIRLKDQDLRDRKMNPNRVRRWFKKYHDMTFQAYLRLLRIGQSFGRIKHGEKVIDAAFDSGYDSLSGFTESFKNAIGHSPKNTEGKTVIKLTRILTPLGPMLAGAIERGICLLEFVDRRMLETQIKRLKKHLNAVLLPGTSKHFTILNTELQEYFEGTRKNFNVPLILLGTEFQQQVWRALMEIPYGERRSYKQQAESIRRPRAVRAVARANGDNSIAIIIPCHRVVGSDGKLVGYGGGIQRKEYLLNLEKENK